MSLALGRALALGYFDGEGRFGSSGNAGNFLSAGGASGSGVGLLMTIAAMGAAGAPASLPSADLPCPLFLPSRPPECVGVAASSSSLPPSSAFVTSEDVPAGEA